ncbi:hypothetical protein ACFSBZ_12585 [Amnibacterium flavum]|uniref:Septum formation-related domain-containing protein n=1 Tax=Amnibacterium flavum TaxID=2173173 RepID=A0A2V1HWM7_9MICO|nr:hypothetical protein [Amnibacterium flavum]PVZ95619.1 hypothetical protein DDQ50_03795 [Amnibacterium flavum]
MARPRRILLTALAAIGLLVASASIAVVTSAPAAEAATIKPGNGYYGGFNPDNPGASQCVYGDRYTTEVLGILDYGLLGTPASFPGLDGSLTQVCHFQLPYTAKPITKPVTTPTVCSKFDHDPTREEWDKWQFTPPQAAVASVQYADRTVVLTCYFPAGTY